MSETRAVHDPFLGKTVEVSNRLTDRLRGKYACGPTLPNGEPEFGWRQHEAPPIQHEAADTIEALVKALEEIATGCDDEHLHPFNSVWAELIKSRAREALSGVGRARYSP